MGTFIILIIFIGLLLPIATFYFMMNKLNHNEKKLQVIGNDFLVAFQSEIENIQQLDDKITNISDSIDSLKIDIRDEINRSMTTLKDDLEAAKPMRPNNWDSVKKAFKAPSRIDVDERD